MPIRLKETPEERLFKEREEAHRRKKRRKIGRSASPLAPTSSSTNTNDAPPKPDPNYPYVFGDPDFDESLYGPPRPPPPSSAFKVDLDNRDEFNERLFEEMARDEGEDAWEAYYLPPRWRLAAKGSGMPANVRVGVDAMDDEEYAEYMREGAWRSTHREEARMKAEEEKLRKERKEKEKADKERRKKETEEKEKRKEEKKQRQRRQEAIQERERYEQKWKDLNDSGTKTDGSDRVLRWPDFPWPISSASIPMSAVITGIGPSLPTYDLVPEHITHGVVSSFLLPSLIKAPGQELPPDIKKTARNRIRSALLSYHPDRFSRLVDKVPEGSERERVRNMGVRVVQVLTEILEGLN